MEYKISISWVNIKIKIFHIWDLLVKQLYLNLRHMMYYYICDYPNRVRVTKFFYYLSYSLRIFILKWNLYKILQITNQSRFIFCKERKNYFLRCKPYINQNDHLRNWNQIQHKAFDKINNMWILHYLSRKAIMVTFTPKKKKKKE